MAVTQLSIYNQALAILGERKIFTLGLGANEAESLLDIHYEEDPSTINTCLEMVEPDFAVLTANLTSPAAPSNHALGNEYTLPANYVSLVGLFVDSDLSERTERYVIEGNTIATDLPTQCWLRYVRNDATLDSWSPSFANVVSAYLALQIAPRFAPQKIEKINEILLSRVEVAVTIEKRKQSEFRPQPSQVTLDDQIRDVYNQAIAMLSQREFVLSDLNETQLRVALDFVYQNDAPNYLIEVAQPRFATRTLEFRDSVLSAEHGYDHVFALTSDYISVVEVHSVNTMDQPVNRYLIESGQIASEYPEIWVRYLSSDTQTLLWTPGFKSTLAAYLADQVKGQFLQDATSIAWIAEQYQLRLQALIEIEGAKEPMRSQAESFLLTDDYRHVYNIALNLLGKRHLTSNTDVTEERAAIDTVINSGAVNYLLELTKPKFANKTVSLTGGVASTEHDLDNVFTLPTDYLSILEVHSESLMDEPVSRYLIEGRTIAAEYSTLYLRFITDSKLITDWTPAFKQLLGAYIADQLKARFAGENELIQKTIIETYSARLNYVIENEGYKEPQRSQRSTATLTDDWRQIYNDALLIMGLDHIVSNDDDSMRRATLDAALATGTVAALLEDINWGFATVSSKLTYNPSLEPDYGYQRVFNYPADMHRLDDIFFDEYFTTAIKNYQDEGDLWFMDVDDIYVKYITTDFLVNPSNWPQFFKRYVAAELANQTCGKLRGDKKNTEKEFEYRKNEAKSIDAMTHSPTIIREGQWSRSRGSDRSRGSNYNGRP